MLLEIAKNFLATFKCRQTGVFSANILKHFAVFANNLDTRKIMTFANFEVIKVVRGGNLHSAGAVFWVGMFISNNWNLTIGEGEFHKTTN